jgi:hypothetical protein
MYEMRERNGQNSAQVSRITLANNIRFSAANFIAMNRTALENRKAGTTSQLVDCVCGKTTCSTNLSQDLNLYDVGGNQIAGSLAKPLYYNTSGELCDPKAENCILQATAKFVCLGSNCGDASSMTDGDPVLRVSYLVSPIPGKKLSSQEVISGPDMDISAKAIRDYAMENNLCVQVSSYSPNTGFAKGGNEIEFQGSGLTDVHEINIGGSSCLILEKTLLKIRCQAPSGHEGLQNILVRYGSLASPEVISFPRGYGYLPNPEEGEAKQCGWHIVGECTGKDCQQSNGNSLPPCIEGNIGEKQQQGGDIYECRC